MVRSVLSLELRKTFIRAAVVRKKGKQFLLSACAEVPRPGRQDALEHGPISAEDVKAVKQAMKKLPSVAVMVAPNSINLAMDRSKFLNMDQSQVSDALRWEAEAFSGVPAQQSMVGYEGLSTEAEKDNFTTTTDDLRVTVFPLTDFQDAKKVLAKEGLKLRRVYSDETCFAVAAGYVNADPDKLVAIVENDDTKVVRVHKGGTSSCQQVLSGVEDIKSHMANEDRPGLESMFLEPFQHLEGPECKILVGGAGGDEKKVTAFLGLTVGMEAVPIDLDCDQADHSGKAAYAVALGAALRELGIMPNSQRVGVTDAVPLKKKLEKMWYLPPAAGVVLIFVLLAFFHVWYQGRLESKIEKTRSLKNEVEEIQRHQAKYRTLKSKKSKLEQRLAELEKEEAFLKTGADARLKQLSNLFFFLMDEVPWEMTLNGIRQDGPRYFVLLGETLSTQAANEMAVKLQRQEWCASATLKDISPLTPQPKGERLAHQFRIDLYLRD